MPYLRSPKENADAKRPECYDECPKYLEECCDEGPKYSAKRHGEVEREKGDLDEKIRVKLLIRVSVNRSIRVYWMKCLGPYQLWSTHQTLFFIYLYLDNLMPV